MSKASLYNYLFILSLFFCALKLSAQASLTGTVKDKGSEETVPFADVILYHNEVLITGTQTDFDGQYSFENLMPGTYDMEVRFLGYKTGQISGVTLINDIRVVQDAILVEEIVTCCGPICYLYKIPLIDFDDLFSGKIYYSDEIKRMAISK